jgi:hypothetical protein
MGDECFKGRLISSKGRRVHKCDVHVLRMGRKSETRLTYARLQLNQIRDTPALIRKGRRTFL